MAIAVLVALLGWDVLMVAGLVTAPSVRAQRKSRIQFLAERRRAAFELLREEWIGQDEKMLDAAAVFLGARGSIVKDRREVRGELALGVAVFEVQEGRVVRLRDFGDYVED